MALNRPSSARAAWVAFHRHFWAGDAAQDGLADDRAEVWGRRIGRLLAAGFFVILLVNLFTGWFY